MAARDLQEVVATAPGFLNAHVRKRDPDLDAAGRSLPLPVT